MSTSLIYQSLTNEHALYFCLSVFVGKHRVSGTREETGMCFRMCVVYRLSHLHTVMTQA